MTGTKLKDLFLKGPFGLTLVSISLGFIVGAVVLLIAGFNPVEAYWAICRGIFSKPKYVSYVIIYATPLIITGLSVAFALRTGLFNIGAEGQFIVGAMTAAIAGYFIQLPMLLHVPLCLFLAMSAGAVWGGLAGHIKARFGVHEVISTIMLNWIALYLSNWSLTLKLFGKQGTGKSYMIDSLIELRDELGAESGLCMVMGCDALLGITEWHRWQELLDWAHIVIIARLHRCCFPCLPPYRVHFEYWHLRYSSREMQQ